MLFFHVFYFCTEKVLNSGGKALASLRNWQNSAADAGRKGKVLPAKALTRTVDVYCSDA